MMRRWLHQLFRLLGRVHACDTCGIPVRCELHWWDFELWMYLAEYPSGRPHHNHTHVFAPEETHVLPRRRKYP